MMAELEQIVDKIKLARTPEGVKPKIIAIDGGGGAGKSTFAGKLSEALGGAPIVQTDDFASWDNPLEWSQGLLDNFLKPFAAGKSARFHLSEWSAGDDRGWKEVAPAQVLILEGVASSRRIFRPYLAFTIYIDTPREERFRRGIARDGEHKRTDWVRWQNEEDEYLETERPDLYANIVLSGAIT
jgi:uridine kinase